ncbi:hypothetical protein HanIR_Chr01g0038441 [Helianthus annuus]|nr:hypothetical protein HanIR_Chr01g0038441 [Helianthus annuus]
MNLLHLYVPRCLMIQNSLLPHHFLLIHQKKRFIISKPTFVNRRIVIDVHYMDILFVFICVFFVVAVGYVVLPKLVVLCKSSSYPWSAIC